MPDSLILTQSPDYQVQVDDILGDLRVVRIEPGPEHHGYIGSRLPRPHLVPKVVTVWVTKETR